jgi:hypothetical protein
MPTRKRCDACLVATLFASLVLLLSRPANAQAPARGTIAGTVPADQGQVRGFRVTAHNLRSMLWYRRSFTCGETAKGIPAWLAGTPSQHSD